MDINTGLDALVVKVRSSQENKLHISSKSFWGQLGIKKRTPITVIHVREEMARRGLMTDLEQDAFGHEPKNRHFNLRHLDIPMPEDVWFTDMSHKTYESEHEVDVFFITPLFLSLGFSEVDFRYDFPVITSEKIKKFLQSGEHPSHIDLVLFDGADRSPANALVMVEAKKPDCANPEKNEKLLQVADQESDMYAISLPSVCRRVATNGDDVLVYDLCEKLNNPRKFRFHRSELKEKWPTLFMILGKQMVMKDKNTNSV